ncbi:hypothetical protein HR12_29975, partial [Microbacterium sp. SUBG005]
VTAQNPMVRFIGSDNMQQNEEMFAVWLQTLAKWEHTTTPYLFLHTPDIAQAPELVDALWQALQQAVPSVGPRAVHPTTIFSFLKSPPIIETCHLPKNRELVWSARCMRC